MADSIYAFSTHSWGNTAAFTAATPINTANVTENFILLFYTRTKIWLV
jgi:hypothetical protein